MDPVIVYKELTTQLGKKEDAADPVGSLLARIKDIIDNQLPIIQKPRGPESVPGQLQSSSATTVTALNVSGRGRLIGFTVFCNQATATPVVTLIVDGLTMASGGFADGVNGDIYYPSKDYFFYYPGTLTTDGDPRNAEIYFKNSLRIDLNPQGKTVTINWVYELE